MTQVTHIAFLWRCMFRERLTCILNQLTHLLFLCALYHTTISVSGSFRHWLNLSRLFFHISGKCYSSWHARTQALPISSWLNSTSRGSPNPLSDEDRIDYAELVSRYKSSNLNAPNKSEDQLYMLLITEERDIEWLTQ